MENFLNKLASMLGATDPNDKQPCPFCGKVHSKAGAEAEDLPQTPEYNVSDGKAGSYEFAPRPIRSIQLLPDNFPDAMAFMHSFDISFAYCASVVKKTPHFHIKNDEDEVERWDIGKWLVVENERGAAGFEVYVWDDGYFRTQLRPVNSPPSARYPEPDGSDDMLSDSDLQPKKKDYRDDPIQTFGHSMQADWDAEQETEL